MLNLISLNKTKELLGIVGTDDDARLSLFIPIVSADVRRILNEPYDRRYLGKITAGSDFLTGYFGVNIGQVLYADFLPADTYVKQVTPDGYVLSAKATADGGLIYPQVNIAQWQAIARMVFYRASVPKGAGDKVQSKSMGPVSVSFGLKINSKWNYPQELIDDLGTPRLATC